MGKITENVPKSVFPCARVKENYLDNKSGVNCCKIFFAFFLLKIWKYQKKVLTLQSETIMTIPMKRMAFWMVPVLALAGCRYHKPAYESVLEYPVKQAPAEEVLYSPDHTFFSVWSPNADSVMLYLYDAGEGGEPLRCSLLKPQKDGSWTGKQKGDLAGLFYTFRIKENGRWYEETPGIFAKAVGINGNRGAIIDMLKTNPEGWSEDKRPELNNLNDAIVYEMHWRDFSAHENGHFRYPGKFLCMTEENVRTDEGMAVGLEHLKELGITHIHILPSYDYGSIDEKGSFSEARVLESGAAEGGNYNWGYDPKNYNVPEGSYSTNPYDPACRIYEMKRMIQACHKAGIRVVLDVVYNHTYNVDGSGFTNTAPGYFYRTTPDGQLGNASGCGNETASERPMMRKFMLESCKYWLTEYHLDGLRFDLMGIHDIQTMNEIRHMADEIDPSILIYGEGWAAGAPQLPEDRLAMKANVRELDRIAAFSDDMRDALRGPFSDDHVGAFLAGLPGHEESIKFGLVGAIDYPQINMDAVNYSRAPWANQPAQMIAYVSCHDDMCLVDRLRASAGVRNEEETAKLDMLAQTAVLTSQGIPFIFCGEEVMRDKKGVHNSFCSPDEINAIDWSLKAKNKAVFDYYAGMIALRKAHPAFRMADADLVRQNVHFADAPDNVIVYQIDGNVVEDSNFIVILNANRKPVTVNVPVNGYRVIVCDGKVNPEGMGYVEDGIAVVPAESALILQEM